MTAIANPNAASAPSRVLSAARGERNLTAAFNPDSNPAAGDSFASCMKAQDAPDPKMLVVETGFRHDRRSYFPSDDILDYRVYESVPKWWRRCEQLMRMDLYLAYRASRLASHYDIVWANSEKVGIPLSFFRLTTPLLVTLHNPESPPRVLLMRVTGIAKRWAGIGLVAHTTRSFLENRLGVAPEKIFQYYSARLDLFRPANPALQVHDAPIMSIGVAKRDYRTLLAALAELEGYRTEIFVSSKYGDTYSGRVSKTESWVRFPSRISEEQLRRRYHESRFVVVPLRASAHAGAGATAVFEASASGKAVIATKTRGMDAFVKDGETGILVPPYDVAAMREAIRRLWEDPDLAERMGSAGRRFLEDKYNDAVVNPGIIAFLRGVCRTTACER